MSILSERSRTQPILIPAPDVFNLIPSGIYRQDVFISKLDAAGNFVWAKRLGGSHIEDAISMAVDAAGNVYTIGNFIGTVDFDPGIGVFNMSGSTEYWSQIFISKLDTEGNFVWAKQIGGIGSDYENNQGAGIALDATGNVYTIGTFVGIVDFDPEIGIDTIMPVGGIYDQDIFINKLDPSGHVIWTKIIGGKNYDIANDGIAIDHSGNVLTTGAFTDTLDLDPGDSVFNLTVGVGGGVENMFISKLNTDGEFVWAKQLGSITNGPGVENITVDKLGNVYFTGLFQGTIDFDPGILTYNLTPKGDEYDADIFISKLDSAGNFAWARSMGGRGMNGAKSIVTDEGSSVYITGGFQDTMDVDPGLGVYNLISIEYSAIFIVKLQDDGTLLWAKQLNGTGTSNVGCSIIVDATANVYVAGNFDQDIDMDPGVGVFSFFTTGIQDICLLKLHDTLSTVNIAEQLGHGLNTCMIYPNPSNGIFNIGLNLDSDSSVKIEIIDITGQLIRMVNQTNLNAGINSIAIDGSELSNGIYFIKIYNDKINNTLKLLINK